MMVAADCLEIPRDWRPWPHKSYSVGPEVLLAGTQVELFELAAALLALRDSYQVLDDGRPHRYSHTLPGTVFHRVEVHSPGRMVLWLVDGWAWFEGDQEAMDCLAISIQNVFREIRQSGSHFHFDYLGDNGVLLPTPVSLVISCSDEPPLR